MSDLSPSRSTARVPRRRRLLPVVVLVAALLATQVTVAAVASAHDELESSTPSADAALTTAPTEVSLVFGEPPNTDFSEVAVTAPSGVAVGDGAAQVSGDVVTQPLSALTESGTYTVTWRVVSGDGHPVSGTFAFTVVVPAVTPTPTTSAPNTSAPSTSAESSAAAPPTTDAPPSDTVISAEESSASTDEGRSGLLLGVGVVIVLALVVGTVLVLRRRPGGSA